jgi:hypothetical protein
MKLCNGSNLQNTFQGTLSCTIHFDKWWKNKYFAIQYWRNCR